MEGRGDGKAMIEERPIFESERGELAPDPDELPVKDRKLYTQPYDLVIESLIDQIDNGTIYMRPLSERPDFQRKYVWSNRLASKLIESVLLNVPIPPCYFSQNEDFELDVIDGQQRLYSIFRFTQNQFKLSNLEVLKEFNGLEFFKLPQREQRQIETHTLRCVVITNQSHPEIKFDVFERLNTNTMPLNGQELRNCIYRGPLNIVLKEMVRYGPWLEILRKKEPDKRMRDEELALRFAAFLSNGINSYRTPQKHWLNKFAKAGMKYSDQRVARLRSNWENAVDVSLVLFAPEECFRRMPQGKSTVVNRALMDLVMIFASKINPHDARDIRIEFRRRYRALFSDEEFLDLISKSVDHVSRTKRRFEIWNKKIESGLI